MNVLSGLFRFGAGSAGQSLDAAIERLASDRQATLTELQASSERRRALLLSDAPDDHVAAIEKIIDGHYRALERIELKEGVAIAELQQAGGRKCRRERL